MVYAEEKARDMTRSLLPSRHRASARYERATIHRSARRQSRVGLAQLARDLEAFEDLSGLDDDVTAEIRQVVRHRRDGDKLAPFIRWARAITRPIPQHSRMDHLRSLVPPGVIGDHALFHLSHESDFAPPAETAHREASRRRWTRNSNPPWLERGEQAELLRALLLAPGGHRAFNRWLRVTYVPQYRSERRHRSCSCSPGCTLLDTVSIPVALHPRSLQGVHDVLPFLAALWGSGVRDDRWSSPVGPFAGQAEAVDTFLRAFKVHHGDVSATVKVLRLEQRMNWSRTWNGRPSPSPSPRGRGDMHGGNLGGSAPSP